MIAKSRCMAGHDFLLVLLAAAMLSLLLWPATPSVHRIDIRLPDGTTQNYQIAANDPKLATLRRQLHRFSKPHPNTQLAISKWRAELGGMYAERTSPVANERRVNSILPVSYYEESAKMQAAAEREAASLAQHHAFWLDFQQRGERDVATETERQQQALALRSSPAIEIGKLQPGPYSNSALLLSSLIGLCVALLFQVWNYLIPNISLVKQAAKTDKQAFSIDSEMTDQQVHQASSAEKHELSKPPQSSGQTSDSMTFQIMIPARWLQVHQPLGVRVRQTAYLTLLLTVAFVACHSTFIPESNWRGLPARLLWGGTDQQSDSPSSLSPSQHRDRFSAPIRGSADHRPIDRNRQT